MRFTQTQSWTAAAIILVVVVILVVAYQQPVDRCVELTCQKLVALSKDIDNGALADDDRLYQRIRQVHEEAACPTTPVFRENLAVMLRAMTSSDPPAFDRAIQRVLAACE